MRLLQQIEEPQVRCPSSHRGPQVGGNLQVSVVRPPHLVSCGCPCAEPSATQRLTGVSSGQGPTQTSEVSLGVRARLLKFPGTSRRGPLWQLPQPQALVPSLRPTDHRLVGGVLTAGVGSPWTPVGPLSSHNTSGDGPRKLTLGGL